MLEQDQILTALIPLHRVSRMPEDTVCTCMHTYILYTCTPRHKYVHISIYTYIHMYICTYNPVTWLDIDMQMNMYNLYIYERLQLRRTCAHGCSIHTQKPTLAKHTRRRTHTHTSKIMNTHACMCIHAHSTYLIS